MLTAADVGGVRERPNRHAWKACEGQPSVGSNPTPSASEAPSGSEVPNQDSRQSIRHEFVPNPKCKEGGYCAPVSRGELQSSPLRCEPDHAVVDRSANHAGGCEHRQESKVVVRHHRNRVAESVGDDRLGVCGSETSITREPSQNRVRLQLGVSCKQNRSCADVTRNDLVCAMAGQHQRNCDARVNCEWAHRRTESMMSNTSSSLTSVSAIATK